VEEKRRKPIKSMKLKSYSPVKSMKLRTQIKNVSLVEKRRLQIAMGASRLFIEKGYFSSNMRAIAKATGMTTGSLYDYITRKEDILCLVFDVFHSLIEQIFAESGITRIEDPVEQLRASIEKALELSAAHNDMVELIFSESKSLPHDFLKSILKRENAKTKFLEGVLKRGAEKGGFVIKDPFLEANFIAYLLSVVPLRSWSFGKRYPLPEIHRYVADFIMGRVCPCTASRTAEPAPSGEV
jgi:TetR/AcrR family transcriptional regulator, cholesterol catabolism regulator